MPDNNQQNSYILWDMSCNTMPLPCGGSGSQDQSCAQTQTWFWVALAGIAVFSLMGAR